MQEHFGQSMNLTCIKLMALLLLALCVVQTVSLPNLPMRYAHTCRQGRDVGSIAQQVRSTTVTAQCQVMCFWIPARATQWRRAFKHMVWLGSGKEYRESRESRYLSWGARGDGIPDLFCCFAINLISLS